MNRGGSPHPVFLSFMRVLFLVYYVNEPAPKKTGVIKIFALAHSQIQTFGLLAVRGVYGFLCRAGSFFFYMVFTSLHGVEHVS